MIKNIVFDFGRVIVDYDELYMTSVFVKDPKEAAFVRDVVFDRLYWDRLDSGDITDEETKAGISSRVPAHLKEAACLAYDNWIGNLSLIDGIKDAVLAARERAEKLLLLSNISQKFSREYKNHATMADILSLFDDRIFSGDLHMVKPSPEIFRFMLEKHGILPEETLFIDDSPKNIASAEALGIHGYLFDGNAKRLKEYILSL